MRSDRWVAPFGMTVALVEPRLPDSRSKRVTLTSRRTARSLLRTH